MPEVLFSDEDVTQITQRGMTRGEVLSQIERFRKGIPRARLVRPCVVGDGIHAMDAGELRSLYTVHSEAAS